MLIKLVNKLVTFKQSYRFICSSSLLMFLNLTDDVHGETTEAVDLPVGSVVERLPGIAPGCELGVPGVAQGRRSTYVHGVG